MCPVLLGSTKLTRIYPQYSHAHFTKIWHPPNEDIKSKKPTFVLPVCILEVP